HFLFPFTAVPFRPRRQPVTYFSHVSQESPEDNNGRPPVADQKDCAMIYSYKSLVSENICT
ncbi:GD14771, partial [Drosophila simulans]